jgi:tetratricopeptide (TPR) repeat protein
MVRARPDAVGTSSRVASLYLLGPMRLLDRRGRDCTPRGGVLQALLAVLALSPDGTKGRISLQDLLWSGFDQKHGSQCLRAALFQLRRALSGLAIDLIEADKQIVRLRVERIWIDVFEYARAENAVDLRRRHGAHLPDLLEGLNVRSSGDDEFEDWIREERQHWGERLEALRQGDDADAPAGAAEAEPRPGHVVRGVLHGPAVQAPGLSVGFLPVVASPPTARATFIGDTVLDGLGNVLRDVMQAEIYDYRDSHPDPPAHLEGPGPTLFLRAKVLEQDDRLMLTLAAYRRERELAWQWRMDLPGRDPAVALATCVGQSADRVCETLERTSRGAGAADTPYHALHTMFRLDDASLAAARHMLQDAHAATGESVHLSLLAYLNSFKVGEHWESYDDSMFAETRQLIEAVLEDNPFNSLTLAMTGHACGYILHDYALGRDLLERATRLDASPAICWDHLALNHLYAGRIEEAMHAAETALRLGSFSPFRFTYETTMCMVCTIRGDYARAIRFGERALARRPNFGCALRYMAVCLGHLGQRDAARQLVSRIRTMAPDFSVDWVRNDRLAVANARAKDNLMLGLQMAGA